MSDVPVDPRMLYQRIVLEHGKNPRNRGPLPEASHSAKVHNPLCGDTITVHVQVEGACIRAVRFEGQGCAIALATASRLTERCAGQPLDEVRRWADRVEAVVRGDDTLAFEELRGVRAFPARRRCATLPWEALRRSLLEHGHSGEPNG